VEDALRVVEHWLTHPRAQVTHPGERHAEILGQLLRSAGTAGNLTTDAHLAALAIEHGATVLSFDRDFARFPGVPWKLPPADQGV
jgi:predicted nucleic acid-binding protein